jgi:ribosome-binding protein aMBF1 (putative translation factor)
MVTAPAHFDNVLARIRAFAAAKGWTPTQLAREAGLSDTVTRGMDREDWAPSGRSVRALEILIPLDWAPGDAVSAAQTATSAAGVVA